MQHIRSLDAFITSVSIFNWVSFRTAYTRRFVKNSVKLAQIDGRDILTEKERRQASWRPSDRFRNLFFFELIRSVAVIALTLKIWPRDPSPSIYMTPKVLSLTWLRCVLEIDDWTLFEAIFIRVNQMEIHGFVFEDILSNSGARCCINIHYFVDV